MVSSAKPIRNDRHLRSLELTSALGVRVDDRAFKHADSGPAVGASGAVSDGDAVSDNGCCVCHADPSGKDGKRGGDEFHAHNISEGKEVRFDQGRGLVSRVFWLEAGGEGKQGGLLTCKKAHQNGALSKGYGFVPS